MLTKRDFVRGLTCSKRVWLDKNRPDLRKPFTFAVEERIQVGNDVGELAKQRYQGGKPAAEGIYDLQLAARETWSRVQAGDSPLFEATFTHGDFAARLDVIWSNGAGGWVIDEVKSATLRSAPDIKTDRVMELAFQLMTVRGAGLAVEQARMVLIDSRSEWNGGPYDAQSMLGAVDLTQRCEESMPKVSSKARHLVEVLGGCEPQVDTNVHCKNCDYHQHCFESRPRHDVIFLPRITAKDVLALRKLGFESIDSIPEDHPISDSRRRVRDVVVSGKPYVSPDLGDALEEIRFPAAFIDYESSNSAFPIYPGTRPYQQVCFQWSAHMMRGPGCEPEHHEFLPLDRADPRAEFCRTLWDVVKSAESVVHYSHFEITQMEAMVKEGIPYADLLLEKLRDTTVDLEKIVSKHLYFEEFMGRTSIKVVLPALVPELSYKDLRIADGNAAGWAFRQMILESTEPQVKEEIRNSLLEYCRQDTLAMVEIYRAMCRLAASNLVARPSA